MGRSENRLEKKWSRKRYQDGPYFETRRMEAPQEKWGQEAGVGKTQPPADGSELEAGWARPPPRTGHESRNKLTRRARSQRGCRRDWQTPPRLGKKGKKGGDIRAHKKPQNHGSQRGGRPGRHRSPWKGVSNAGESFNNMAPFRSVMFIKLKPKSKIRKKNFC